MSQLIDFFLHYSHCNNVMIVFIIIITVVMTVFWEECRFQLVTSFLAVDTNMPTLYRWMKTYLMACWECLSSSKHQVWTDFQLIRRCSHKFHNFSLTPLFHFLAKYIWRCPDLWGANYSLQESTLKTKASIDLFIMFSRRASSRKLPSLSVEGRDAQDDGLYSKWQESGRQGNNWSHLWMTILVTLSR